MPEFHDLNLGYVLELYDRYRRDPSSVDADTRSFFSGWAPPAEPAASVHSPADRAPAEMAGAADRVVEVVRLAQEIRGYGYLAAQLDPLGSEPPGDPLLTLEAHGLTEADLAALPASLIGGPAATDASSALEAVAALREIYCGSIGYDYAHLRNLEERQWLRHAAESRRFRPTGATFSAPAMLARLTEVEAFEQFLHRIFPGKHRFSIEGLDMMVPMLDEIICEAAGRRIGHLLIGMAHRGRLNVLAHVLGKPYSQILAEFKDPLRSPRFEDDLGWTGDVKYHKGAVRAIAEGDPVNLIITMPPNPSHLEAVNPVVAGMARAAGTRATAGGAPTFDPDYTLPVVIHGDAAFPGQGVVAETLNLSRLPGYWTGGTIHLIANNQIGFTTDAVDARSTLFASDLAKGFSIPIVHVNADDPEACVEAARLAFAYRMRFQKDFLIDLIGYRRHGHNEGDEPAFTQPLMAGAIRAHPTVRQRWAETLIARGHMDPAEPEFLMRRAMSRLQQELESLRPAEDLVEPEPAPPPPGAARGTRTAVALKRLQALGEALLDVPEGFTPHPKLVRQMARRREALANPEAAALDWAAAEDLALATILEDGIPIRLTGQDAERGTFSQRHAVLHDAVTGAQWTPLQGLPQAAAAFEVHNSPLTENAVLGFEYGYNVQEPGRLVLWEAQYGDFINGAQTIIDEFLVSARAKWGQTPSLVLLLPHGYEGAGPDHSSGRVERFLQMAAETNLRVANATTAAQVFHLLRRQAALLEGDPLPLVLMTPKSLLRNPMTYSSLKDMARGRWLPVIDDPRGRDQPRAIRRVVLASGKFALDLAASNYEARRSTVLVRLEQLYPFPLEDLADALEGYPELEEVVWAQEEPVNMGAWEFVSPLLGRMLAGRAPLRCVARPRNASPAEGSAAQHSVMQMALIREAFAVEAAGEEQPPAPADSHADKD